MKVVLAVLLAAQICVLRLVQVIGEPELMVIVGAELSSVTVAVAEEVQPVWLDVPTSVYMPAALASGFCCVLVKPFGPVHK